MCVLFGEEEEAKYSRCGTRDDAIWAKVTQRPYRATQHRVRFPARILMVVVGVCAVGDVMGCGMGGGGVDVVLMSESKLDLFLVDRVRRKKGRARGG